MVDREFPAWWCWAKDRGRIRFYRFRAARVYLPRPAIPVMKTAAYPNLDTR